MLFHVMVSTEAIYPKVAGFCGCRFSDSTRMQRSCCSKKALRAACAQDSSLPSLGVALVEEATVDAMR